MKGFIRILALIFYYTILIHLPESFYPMGSFSKIIRGLACKLIFQKCGKNINVEKGANFGKGSYVTIGDNSGIGVNASLPSKISIGKDVMMGPDVLILSQLHNFDDLTIPMIEQGVSEFKKVIIEDDVWIGARVVIMPGIKIGKGSIVGVGAVVTENVPPYSIVGGIPAKVIKYRK
jgi:maltose O-acetyltransferase